MRRLIILYWTAVVFCLLGDPRGTFVAKASAASTSVKTWGGFGKEIVLPAVLHRRLASDFPIRGLTLSDENTIWLSGARYLWRIQVFPGLRPTLQRLELPAAEPGGVWLSGAETIMSSSASWVLMAGRRELVVMNLESRTFSRFALPNWQGGQTVGLSLDRSENSSTPAGQQTSAMWIHTDGAFEVNLQTKSLAGTCVAPSMLSGVTRGSYDSLAHQFWLTRDRELYSFRCSKKNAVAEADKDAILRFRARNPIIDAQVGGEGKLYVATPMTVMRFGADGRSLQAIPVQQSRRLAAMSPESATHDFVFTDGTWERFDLIGQRRGATQLAGIKGSPLKWRSFGNVAAAIQNGRPSFYRWVETP